MKTDILLVCAGLVASVAALPPRLGNATTLAKSSKVPRIPPRPGIDYDPAAKPDNSRFRNKDYKPVIPPGGGKTPHNPLYVKVNETTVRRDLDNATATAPAHVPVRVKIAPDFVKPTADVWSDKIKNITVKPPADSDSYDGEFKNITDVVDGNSITKRDQLTEQLPIAIGPVTCSSDAARVPEDEYHAALNLLFENPLFYVPPSRVVYAVSGDTVVYMCNNNGDGWNPASLVEFMTAMDEIDSQCPVTSMAGSREMLRWQKTYGREKRGNDICGHKWVSDQKASLVPNRVTFLLDNKKCESYVYGVERWLGDRGDCNDNAAGTTFWKTLKNKFDWYHHPAEDLVQNADGDYVVDPRTEEPKGKKARD